MDPLSNQNPALTPNPMPAPTPVTPPAQAPQLSQIPQPAQVPVQSQASVVQPQVATASSMNQMSQTANPVIMPNMPHNAIGQDFVMPQPQGVTVPPVANPGFVNATDPITMPAPPKAPDPVEEELKAPLKAAEPVPGSIGSAISVPAAGASQNLGANEFPTGSTKTQNVSFTDPAASAEVKPVKTKKKTSKSTLIALTIVAIMVVIALTAVLLLQLNGTLVF